MWDFLKLSNSPQPRKRFYYIFQRAVYSHSQRKQKQNKPTLEVGMELDSITKLFFLLEIFLSPEEKLQETKAYVSDQKVSGQKIPDPYKASHGI